MLTLALSTCHLCGTFFKRRSRRTGFYHKFIKQCANGLLCTRLDYTNTEYTVELLCKYNHQAHFVKRLRVYFCVCSEAVVCNKANALKWKIDPWVEGGVWEKIRLRPCQLPTIYFGIIHTSLYRSSHVQSFIKTLLSRSY